LRQMKASPMHTWVEAAARALGARLAIVAGDEQWTYRRLDSVSSSFASHLASSGVRPGDRVVVMTANRPEFVVAINAISKLGATSVLISPAWKSLECEHAFELTDPVYAVGDAESSALLCEHLGGRRVTDVDDDAGTATAGSGTAGSEAGDVPLARRVDPGSDAVFVFSSGTTGMPKAVRHTHRSLAVATSHWCAALGLGPADRFQIATPPSHILGLLNLLAAASAGATVRLHRRFDLDEVLHRISTERMTLEMAVAPIALAMANHPDLERYDLSSLRYIMWGATPVTQSVAETVTRRSGVRWLPAYGASELPVIAVNPVHDPSHWRLDSAGLAPSGVSLRVADLENGDVLGAGGVGEIQARSRSLMAGYLPADADEDAFVDGWYRTGDVGWLEKDGWVHITDRSKEMIKVSGFQVAPAEIESVLLGHPSVVDCAVFGVPDDRSGELPVAAVQLDPINPVSSGELERLVADSLATYKRVSRVVIVDTIPRLPSGKVLRRSLREQWTGGSASFES